MTFRRQLSAVYSVRGLIFRSRNSIRAKASQVYDRAVRKHRNAGTGFSVSAQQNLDDLRANLGNTRGRSVLPRSWMHARQQRRPSKVGTDCLRTDLHRNVTHSGRSYDTDRPLSILRAVSKWGN